jgi:hypothetical protein
MKRLLASTLLATLVLMNACQKETSFETGGDPSEGTLGQDGVGDCSPMTVTGAYVEGTALDGNTNQILLDVNVTKTGAYKIYTDTLNGVHFSGTGVFAATGNTAVTIKGSGTPLGPGPFNYNVIYEDNDTCTVSVDFLPSTASGPATFTFASTGGNCSVSNQSGTFLIGTPLAATNTITLAVNVTAIGTYTNITTTAGGMTFQSGPGSFTSTGPNTIILTGSGTPTTGGPNNFTVTHGTSTCNFSITVASGNATGTLTGGPAACAPITIGGTYTVGQAFVAGTHTVQVQVNVATTGAYTISTNTVTGFSFTASGNFTATGNQLVTLNATGGPPSTAGSQTFTVTFGTSTCTFQIPVSPALSNDYFPRTTNSNWSYEFDDVAVDSVFRRTNSTRSIAGNTYNVFMITGDVASGFDSSGYYRRSGGSYYEFLDVGTFIGFDNPQWVEYIFLKDDQAVGHIWKSAGFTGTFTPPPPDPPQTLSLRFSYKIAQKDVPVSIVASTGTVNYQNVIVVEERYELEIAPNVWQDVSDIVGYAKAYYARGIGLIKYEFFDDQGGAAGHQELRRYQVY